MKFEFDTESFGESLKQQLRDQIQEKLNQADLLHVRILFQDDGCTPREIEGHLNQEELDKAMKAVFGDIRGLESQLPTKIP